MSTHRRRGRNSRVHSSYVDRRPASSHAFRFTGLLLVARVHCGIFEVVARFRSLGRELRKKRLKSQKRSFFGEIGSRRGYG